MNPLGGNVLNVMKYSSLQQCVVVLDAIRSPASAVHVIQNELSSCA